jgi:hypothetical protein
VVPDHSLIATLCFPAFLYPILGACCTVKKPELATMRSLFDPILVNREPRPSFQNFFVYCWNHRSSSKGGNSSCLIEHNINNKIWRNESKQTIGVMHVMMNQYNWCKKKGSCDIEFEIKNYRKRNGVSIQNRAFFPSLAIPKSSALRPSSFVSAYQTRAYESQRTEVKPQRLKNCTGARWSLKAYSNHLTCTV